MSNPYSFQRARELRRVSATAEQRLWECLRDRWLHGLRFRRQQPLHGYILDFYCADCHLVVELDGAVHQDQEQQAYDAHRNEHLQERGLTVLRFTNGGVEQTLGAVLRRIAAAAGLGSDLTPAFGHPSPLTANGEGPEAEGSAAGTGVGADRPAGDTAGAGRPGSNPSLASSPSPHAVGGERSGRRPG
jgi:very-short-patch-repair endonuclease